MLTPWRRRLLCSLALIFVLSTISIQSAHAENEDADTSGSEPAAAAPAKSQKKNKYFVPDPHRIDAGSFHVGFEAGGNFYIEPQLSAVTLAPVGNYFQDFGFGGGVVFDYDYDDINLGLRGFLGYKYVLSSVHVFSAEAIVRKLFPFSEKVNFALGAGVSAAYWYRVITATAAYSESLFLPSLILNAGFDFNPFMVDFKWLINRFGTNSTIMGLELYFGVRL